jgi:hypothetical protein
MDPGMSRAMTALKPGHWEKGKKDITENAQ